MGSSFENKEKSLEHKINIGKSMKGKPGKSGKENPFYGKSHTDESLKRISESSKTEFIQKNLKEKCQNLQNDVGKSDK